MYPLFYAFLSGRGLRNDSITLTNILYTRSCNQQGIRSDLHSLVKSGKPKDKLIQKGEEAWFFWHVGKSQSERSKAAGNKEAR